MHDCHTGENQKWSIQHSSGPCESFCAGEIADLQNHGMFHGPSDEICSPREGVCNGCKACQKASLYNGQTLDTFSAAVTVECLAGYTIGGLSTGATTFTIECNAHGEFASSMEGAQCEQPGFPVAGEVTDAQSASKKLSGASVTYKREDGTTVAQAISDSSGQYSMTLAAGTYEATAALAGYITFTRNVTVVGPISIGGSADLSPPKVLPAGSWRIILTWGKHSRDLDSYSQWGGDDTEEVAWYTNGLSHYDRVTGIKVVLDRDDTDSYGPETSTYSGTGSCQAGNKCLIHFMVVNYDPNDGPLGSCCKGDGLQR
jgi:hypothetical protein